MFCMSIGKSVFDVIEHCSTEGDLPTPNDQGRQKRQYFRISTRSSGEKLTIFVNLSDNTDSMGHNIEPPSQIPWPGVLSSPTEHS